LESGEVTTHPFVVGEVACGSVRRRREFLELIAALPACEVVDHDQVLSFIETQRLTAGGLWWVDVHLLASARVAGERLLTHDAVLLKPPEDSASPSKIVA
jgi:hypothetical protein